MSAGWWKNAWLQAGPHPTMQAEQFPKSFQWPVRPLKVASSWDLPAVSNCPNLETISARNFCTKVPVVPSTSFKAFNPKSLLSL